MTSRASAAFAPGHVSGVFAVHDEHDDALRKGSRGAGWSLDKGATAVARPGSGRLTLEGQPAELQVTRRALGRLAADAARGVDVDVRIELPVGQGFGMSAAGSLAACLAVSDLLDLEPEAALAAAHTAEVESGTGLGDAIGSWVGGAEVRVAPGIPPHGGATRIDVDAAFLFCVLGAGIPTPRIIRDEAWKRRTREHGDASVDRILAAGRAHSWDVILTESHRFSKELGLMPAAMANLGGRLDPGLQWGQAMLGNTMWVTGDAAALASARPILEQAGRVIAARVDANGARLVRAP